MFNMIIFAVICRPHEYGVSFVETNSCNSLVPKLASRRNYIIEIFFRHINGNFNF